MKIKEITFEHRNDFHWLGECEHCGHTRTCRTGYDDANYHDNVIPAMHCVECGKNSRGASRKAADAVEAVS